MEPSARRPDNREHDEFQVKDLWNRFIESRHWGSGLPEPGGPPREALLKVGRGGPGGCREALLRVVRGGPGKLSGGAFEGC